jgi:hypothetical protein
MNSTRENKLRYLHYILNKYLSVSQINSKQLGSISSSSLHAESTRVHHCHKCLVATKMIQIDNE